MKRATIRVAVGLILSLGVISCSKKTERDSSRETLATNRAAQNYNPRTNAIDADQNGLFTRVFKITNLVVKLDHVVHIRKDETVNNAFRRLLQSKGVDMESPAAVFVKAETGLVMVKTKLADLDKITSAVEEMEMDGSF